MSGSSYTVEAILKATGVEQFSSAFENASKQVEEISKVAEKSTGGFKDMTKGIGKIAGAIGVTKLIGKGFDMVAGSVGGAIERFDTLSNANKVFENMGFGAKETANTMDSLTDSLDGLPTAANDAIQNIQRISMANGDIESAGKLFEHLNYAVLATGKSQEDVNSTVEMFSRSLQRGTMNGHEWDALMRNMGPTMNNMADMMGISINELQKGLSDGTVSFEDFEDSLHELAVNGNGDFVNLEQQARDMTSGIGTAIKNLSNRIKAGIEQGILEPLDDALGANGLPKIGEMVDMLSSAIRDSIKALAPYVTASVDAVIGIMDKFEKMKQSIKESILGILPDFDLFTNKIGLVWNSIKDAFSEGNMEHVGEQFKFMFSLIFQRIEEALPILLNKGLEIIGNIIEGITTKVPEFYAKGAEFMVVFYTVLADFIPKLLVMGANFVVSLLQGITERLPEWVAIAVEMVVKLANTVKENLPQIVAKGQELLSSAAKGFKQKFPEIVSAGWEMIKTLAGELIKNLPTILNAGADILIAVVDGILSMIGSLLKATGTVVDTVWNTIKETDWVSVGKDIISGLASGISASASALWRAAKGVLGSFKDNVLGFFGIKSPSRVMADEVGKHIPSGIGMGIKKNEKPMLKSAIAMSESLQNAFTSPTMDIAGNVARSNAQVDQRVSHEISNSNGASVAMLLRQLLAETKDGKYMVMDSGELVAATYPHYDNAGGKQTLYTERWGGF